MHNEGSCRCPRKLSSVQNTTKRSYTLQVMLESAGMTIIRRRIRYARQVASPWRLPVAVGSGGVVDSIYLAVYHELQHHTPLHKSRRHAPSTSRFCRGHLIR